MQVFVGQPTLVHSFKMAPIEEHRLSVHPYFSNCTKLLKANILFIIYALIKINRFFKNNNS